MIQCQSHITVWTIILIIAAYRVTYDFQGFLVTAEWKKIDNPCLCQEFRCKDGVFCLHATKVCNGVPDCIGGEDEKNPSGTGKCVRKRANCGKDEFKCKFGDCIKLEKVCDGTIDCWGAVDEAIDFCTWVHGNETEINSAQHDPNPKS